MKLVKKLRLEDITMALWIEQYEKETKTKVPKYGSHLVFNFVGCKPGTSANPLQVSSKP